MKKFSILFWVTFFLVWPLTSNGQNIQVSWTGGSGGGNSEICGNNMLTITADTIAAGLTYRWIAHAEWCDSSYVVNSGSQVIYFGQSRELECQAINSLNQVVRHSLPIPVINPTYNGGICVMSQSVPSACFGDSVGLEVNRILSWNGAVSVNPGDTILQWQKNGIDIPGTVNEYRYYATTSGAYRLKFSVGCGIGFSNIINVNIYPPLMPVISGNTDFCQGSSTVLSVAPGYAYYNWSPGSSNWYSMIVNTGGTYSVTVTDTAYCQGTASVIVTEHPNPAPQINGNSIVCLPQTTTLNAGGAYSMYQWNIGAVTQSITVSTIGTYTVTVTDNNGCTGSDSIQVTGPYATISGDNTICSGNSSNLTIAFAGNAPFAYSYTNGVTVLGPFTTVSNPAIITVSPGTNTTYTLVNYGDANCNGNVFGSAAITVSNPAPVITTGDSTLCQTQITVLDAGSGWTGYYWNTNNITQTINVSALGVYTVTVTDANGCTGTDNIFIGSQPPYTTALSASGPLGICLGDSVQLIAQTPMVFYTWYRNNILIPGATSSTFWASVTGKYKCQSLDTSGCAATSNPAKVAIVCFPPPPPVEKVADLILPDGINFTLSPNPTNGIFNVNMMSEADEFWEARLYDITGKLLQVHKIEPHINRFTLNHPVTGFYIVEVYSGDHPPSRKPIIIEAF